MIFQVKSKNRFAGLFALSIMAVVWPLLFLSSCERDPEIPGYTLLDKRFIKEMNAVCYYFEHDKTGAKILKVASGDQNNIFAIGFRTPPEDDCGTPHIIEHSVLNGSENFPVKSPFDELLKGSLNTFINAMTYPDFTVYPVSSVNEKDYFNLMHVYLDAVFYPLIYEKPEIMMQEGWHYELKDPSDLPVYKGVVYNEMKGAFSSPEYLTYTETIRMLFPENCYSKESAGNPDSIPNLTYVNFINYHRKYYHPSNSYIYLAGNADMGKEMAFIDSAYLSHFSKKDIEVDIPVQKAFDSWKEVVIPYSFPVGADTKDQAILSFGMAFNTIAEPDMVYKLQILMDVLVNQESGLLRRAIQEEGIGSDINGTGDGYLKQPVLNIVVKNANLSDSGRFVELIRQTLQRTVDEGLDQKAVEGAVNRLEFQLGEGEGVNKKLYHLLAALPVWMNQNDPYSGIEYEAYLNGIRESLSSGDLEKFIKNEILDNKHAVLVVLNPECGLESLRNKNTNEKLADIKASLNEDDIQNLILLTSKLIAAQETPDPPEALAKIPHLSIEDIDPKTEYDNVELHRIAGSPSLFFNAFTNNILYADFLFDLQVIPGEKLPYAALLSELWGKLGTEKYSYDELEKELNIYTGGFEVSLMTFPEQENPDILNAKISTAMKAMIANSGKMTELASEILLHTDFQDTARIHELLKRKIAAIESQIENLEPVVLLNRIRSYNCSEGMFDDLTGGFRYYWFLKELDNHFGHEANELVSTMELVSSDIVNRDNVIVSVTAAMKDYRKAGTDLKNCIESFPEEEVVLQDWKLIPEKQNEGFRSASKVQNVVLGANYRALGYPYNGHMWVLYKILNMDYLQEEVRVKGGAYAGFSYFSRTGDFFLMSYRDPNLRKTLDVFEGAPDFLRNYQADEENLTSSIIGAISLYDYPLTPQQKGRRATRFYLAGYTEEGNQQLKDEILSTRLEDIHAFADMMADLVAQHNYIVYGNEDKLLANEDLFMKVLSPEGE